MNLNGTAVILAQAEAASPGPAAAPSAQQAPAWTALFPFVLIFIAMYFVLIRPQQKRQKDLNNLLKGLRPGDRVVTNSGIVGTVVSVKEKDRTVSLRSAETKLEVLKSAISEITERSGSPSTSTES